MIENTCLPWHRKSTLGAKIRLPDLTAQEALLVAKILESIAAAIWRAHGYAMADFIAAWDPDDPTDYDPPHSAATPTNTSDTDIF